MAQENLFLLLAIGTLALWFTLGVLAGSGGLGDLAKVLLIPLLPMYLAWIAVTWLHVSLAPWLPEHGWLADAVGVLKLVLGLLPYMALDRWRRWRAGPGVASAQQQRDPGLE